MTKGRKPYTTYTRHFSGKTGQLLWNINYAARTALGIGISEYLRRAGWLYARHPELWEAEKEYATPEELAEIYGEIGQA